ncbi:MAG: ion channel [Candidatus Binataceae bacterium]
MTTEVVRKSRYALLLLCLLLLSVVVPFFEGTSLGVTMMDILGGALLASGAWAASHRRRDLVILIALVAITEVLRLVPIFGSELYGAIAATALGIVFMAYITAMILRDVLKARQVRLDTIGGAICGYLMIGITWGTAYFLIDLILPGSFGSPVHLQQSANAVSQQARYMELVYYSIVTLTTVGYGDIHATAQVTRNLSAMEAMVGQFYIAILVARLVGLEIIQSRGAN